MEDAKILEILKVPLTRRCVQKQHGEKGVSSKSVIASLWQFQHTQKWVKKVLTLPPATINVKSPTKVQECGCIVDCCATDIQIVQLFSIQIFRTP